MAAINFPASPSNGDTHQGFVYNSTLGVWQSAGSQTAVTSFTGLSDTPSTLGTAGQIAKVNSGATALEFADQSGVTVYATVDLLPGTGNTGDLAFVTATNRLYLWNGTGWYNIALINTTPSISGVNSSYELASDGTATVITITAVDAEGIPITYSIASDTSGNIATVTQGTGASSNVFTITPSTNDSNAGTFSLTFRASDGVNIASSIASFELVFKVVNSNYTTALITSVGANNAVNNSFVDSSTNSHTITAGGNAHQTTFSPYRHGGYSTYFDGSGDYLNFNGSSISIGTGDFTIEAYVYHTGNSNDTILSTTGCAFVYGINGQLRFYTGTGSNIIDTGTAYISNRWVHVAAVRTSGVLKIFQDGTEVYSGAYTHNIANFTTAYIGEYFSSGNAYFQGYITDLRVVVGTALYTSNYTPPTERLTAITNTGLLTCHLPYIADGSTNSHAITVNGNTKTQPFAPYDYEGYDASTNGGSMYFDGSGDGVEAPNHTSFDIGSGDFTIETWFYSSNPDNGYIFGKGDGTTAGGTSFWMSGGAGAGLYLFHGGSYTIMQTGALPINQWTHLAFVRNGTNLSTYINGTSVHSTTASITVNTTSNVFDIANYPSTAWIGNIEDFRFVKGTAVYTSDFTPPTAPLTAITNTSLLLSGTNAGIIDKSQSVEALTLYGDAKSSTTQSKYLSSSMSFDGTGDYIQSAYDADLFNRITFPSGVDFTVEAWIYLNTAISTSHTPLIVGAGDGVDASPAHYFNWALYFDTGGSSLNFGRYDGSTFTGYSKTNNISATTWTHVAVTRNGTDLKFFVDGTQLGTTETDSTNWSGVANFPLSIGRWYHSGGTPDDLDGYLSDIRITKGLARYTANFTPPTAELKG